MNTMLLLVYSRAMSVVLAAGNKPKKFNLPNGWRPDFNNPFAGLVNVVVGLVLYFFAVLFFLMFVSSIRDLRNIRNGEKDGGGSAALVSMAVAIFGLIVCFAGGSLMTGIANYLYSNVNLS